MMTKEELADLALVFDALARYSENIDVKVFDLD